MKIKPITFLLIAFINVFSFQLVAQKTKVKSEQVKSLLSSYENYVDENNDAHLKEFMDLIAIPRISSILHLRSCLTNASYHS